MKYSKQIIVIIILLFCNSFYLFSQQVDPSLKTSKEVMDDFMSQRFGMFIHWGPVALRGTEIGWSRNKLVEEADYDNLFKEFNPVLFDANAWVMTAKNAGMKYLTITAKHHDGFCLWPSAFTEFDIEGSLYKKDIIGELAKACKKNNVKFCVYFTILDWHDKNYPIHNDGKGEQPDGNMNVFRTTMKNQLKEIVEKYNPYMLWFDGQWEAPWTDEMGVDMYKYLKSLKKDLIINNRLGKEMAGTKNKKIDVTKMVGDFDTPEKKIGNLNMSLPWESCMTIANQWAWKPNDKVKTLKECIQTLVKTASGNGNLLLNVGPMADGRIEQRQIDLLKLMGDWLKIYGESIYNTNGGPYVPNDIFSATRKGNYIYIHVFDDTKTDLLLPVIEGVKILSLAWMNGKTAEWKEADGKYQVKIPANLPDKLSNVLVLQIDKPALDILVQKVSAK